MQNVHGARERAPASDNQTVGRIGCAALVAGVPTVCASNEIVRTNGARKQRTLT
jgi:hypothetical protein